MTVATPKVIAFLLPNLGGGGAERVALTLAKAFIVRGHEVDLVVMERRGELLDAVPSGVRIVDLNVKRMRNVVRPLVRYLRARRPDAIQISMWPLTVVGILAARVSRVPMRVVVSDHAALSKQYAGHPLTLTLLRITVKHFYPIADARIVVSEGAARDLSRISGLERESFDVVYNPIFVKQPASKRLPAVEALWGSAEARILSVGNLKAQKNHALLIRSFARLLQHIPAKLMLVGSGELEENLKQLASSLGVANNVIFAGFVTDPWPYYASANLFVLSSDYEGFGNVLVEAMACGLPVVATDCESGPREILGDGRFGRLVPIRDEGALAHAMADELRKPDHSELLRKRAEDLCGSRTADRYLELLLG